MRHFSWRYQSGMERPRRLINIRGHIVWPRMFYSSRSTKVLIKFHPRFLQDVYLNMLKKLT